MDSNDSMRLAWVSGSTLVNEILDKVAGWPPDARAQVDQQAEALSQALLARGIAVCEATLWAFACGVAVAAAAPQAAAGKIPAWPDPPTLLAAAARLARPTAPTLHLGGLARQLAAPPEAPRPSPEPCCGACGTSVTATLPTSGRGVLAWCERCNGVVPAHMQAPGGA
jgi:hypothetical protein